MSKELFISSSPHETKLAVLEDDQLVEVFFERDTGHGLVGNIYKGRVSRVLPGMQSAFVDIGLDRDAFLYVSDFFEDSEEYDKVVSEAEAKVSRDSQASAPVSAIAPEPREAEFETTVVETAPPLAEAPPPQPAVARLPPEMPLVAMPSTPPGVIPASPPASASPSVRPERAGSPEHRGRRRRRRGRGFREDRPGAGPERTERAERPSSPERLDRPTQTDRSPARETESHEAHDFEILPGESVAKYAQAGGGQGSPESTEAETGTERKMAPPEMISAAPADISLSALSALDASRLTEILNEQLKDKIQPEMEDDLTSVSNAPAEPAPVPETATATAYDQAQTTGTPEAAEPIPLQLLEVAPVVEEPPVSFAEPDAPAARETESESESESEATTRAATPSLSESAGKEFETAGAEPIHPVAPASTVLSVPEEVVTATENLEVDKAKAEPEAEPEAYAESDDADATEPETAENEAVQGNGQAAAPAPADSGGEAAPSSERTYTLRDGQQQRPRFAPRRRRGGPRRGPAGEARRAESSRPGNNQPVQISELLREGQEILVQIAKEPLGTKGARITSHIALPGRYLVYMPTIHHIGVSRKISSEEERLRLRSIILENRGGLTGGFIVRTAGQGRPEEELKADLRFLSTLWNEIRAKAERIRAPALMHRDLDLVQRILRDTLSPDFKTIRADSEAQYERVLEFVNRCQPSLVGHVKLYDRETPLFEEFGVQDEIDRALKPKVWLKSGGFIVINQTEALVAIDVNTGKYVGKTNRLEDTIVKTNIDAVKEIVRQIRLRDLGGIIVIDFIDMDERRNRQKVVQALEEALRYDRAPTNILSINEFGLVALTRKRVKQSLERTLCEPCHYCTGAGWIKSPSTICYEILEEARKMAAHIEGRTITLRVSPEVAQALKSREGTLLAELEALTRKDVIIKNDPTVHQERFEIF